MAHRGLSSTTVNNYRSKLRKLIRAYPILPEGENKQRCWNTILKLCDQLGLEPDSPTLTDYEKLGRPRTEPDLSDIVVPPVERRKKNAEVDPKVLMWQEGTPEYAARLEKVELRKQGLSEGEIAVRMDTTAVQENQQQDELVHKANEELTERIEKQKDE